MQFLVQRCAHIQSGLWYIRRWVFKTTIGLSAAKAGSAAISKPKRKNIFRIFTLLILQWWHKVDDGASELVADGLIAPIGRRVIIVGKQHNPLSLF